MPFRDDEEVKNTMFSLCRFSWWYVLRKVAKMHIFFFFFFFFFLEMVDCLYSISDLHTPPFYFSLALNRVGG